jgi:hypothetical protein
MRKQDEQPPMDSNPSLSNSPENHGGFKSSFKNYEIPEDSEMDLRHVTILQTEIEVRFNV